MTSAQLDRLRVLLTSVYATDWHAGRTVGRTLYHGDGPDDLLGMMDSRPLAELVVLCHAYALEQLAAERDAGGHHE